ncbi:MarR family winged helix-turn-helix transcriptional regulator [Streptosporangium lutulentum]|uniref:DNA-binding MarR family transcriptional regulator n=1 Tax=Streptosporangium lutulentum TaxID=1461250 RepID=A0ABT9QP12_9ACTN|nr:MarR family winged helix-turn-helix transcriptional regulator [Streptosporangium lutulentum]MDP9848505.1 DNA-binding MarR family transcriptional regulator [Streptosporangium lutulentum]
MSSAPVPAPRPSPAEDAAGQSAAETLKDDFAWSLSVILRAYLRSVEESLNDIPGGPRGYQVIASASQNLAANQGVMASQLGIDRTVLTYLIDDLEAAGLVTRQPDPADRRSRRVVATEAGQALWQDRRNALAHAEAHILSTLGNEESTFKELLKRVAVYADRGDPLQNTCQAVESVESACQAVEGVKDACQAVESLEKDDDRRLGVKRRSPRRD